MNIFVESNKISSKAKKHKKNIVNVESRKKSCNIKPGLAITSPIGTLYQELLEAIENENFFIIRECSTKLLTDQSELEKETEVNLLKSIAKRMCNDKHIDIEKEFEIFWACRDLLCENYDEDIDLKLVCYWGLRVKQDETGKYHLK